MPTQRLQCDLLVRNAHVLTLDPDRAVCTPGAVAVQGRNIAAVGPERELLERYAPRREIDADGGTVHPGFVDGHYHLGVHLSRGALSDDPSRPSRGAAGESGASPFARWFNALGDEDEYVSTLVAAVEMLRAGVTCFMEAGTAFSTAAVAEAAEVAGIRALVADPFLWDVTGIERSAAEIERAPASTERCLERLGGELGRNRDPDALVRGHVALYGIGSASDELQLTAKSMADEHRVVVAQHVAFLPDDAEAEARRLERHPVRHLEAIGALGSSSTFVHANILHDDEVEALVGARASIVWHPANYMFYNVAASSGYRIAELDRRGLNAGFGTDVAKVWSFGEGAFVAYLLARHLGEYLSAQRLLEMMTLGGAQAVGLEDRIGSLEPGKRADLVVRNPWLAESQPGVDRVQDIVLVSRTRSVATVVCNGEIVLQAGRSTRLDERALAHRARACAESLRERAGIAPLADA